MSIIEILVVIFCVLVVVSNIGVFVYRKYKHLPTGECKYCSSSVEKMLKEYHKIYKSNDDIL